MIQSPLEFEFSEDGASWSTAGSFSRAMVVGAVGVMAGNAVGDPAYTARFDYFFK